VLGDGVTTTVDVSIGTAVHPLDGRDPDALLAAADARMHEDERRRARRADTADSTRREG
jgi:hypothetical protein